MPERETGPVGETGPAHKLDGDETSSCVESVAQLDDPAAQRRRWAYGLIRRASSPVPSYGSSAWATLADGDPDKVAGCVVAAEAWAQDAENLIDDLRREIDVRREVAKREEDAEYRARAAAHRHEWARLSQTGKSFAERRAVQLASVKPRPGDYTGRGSA